MFPQSLNFKKSRIFLWMPCPSFVLIDQKLVMLDQINGRTVQKTGVSGFGTVRPFYQENILNFGRMHLRIGCIVNISMPDNVVNLKHHVRCVFFAFCLCEIWTSTNQLLVMWGEIGYMHLHGTHMGCFHKVQILKNQEYFCGCRVQVSCWLTKNWWCWIR